MLSLCQCLLSAFLLVLIMSAPGLAIESDVLANAAITVANERMGERLFGIVNSDAPFLEQALKGAHVKLKVFEPQEPNASATLGFEYSYAKDIAHYAFSAQNSEHSGLTLNIAADGNVAFDRHANPNDLLKTSGAFLYYRSGGGVLPKKLDPKLLNRMEDVAVKAKTVSELDNLPEWKQLSEEITNQLTDQYYFDLAATGGMESDQSFVKKQYYYGVYGNLIAKGWHAENSPLATFNILDYPAALLRLISGVDKAWRPSGSAFPELLIGLDHVDPSNDPIRKAVTNDVAGFERARVEVSFRTLAASYQGARAYIEANFRHYQEIAPSAAVKAAKLDQHTYFTIAMLLPKAKGLYFSYTTGKLPLDAKNDQVYELGVKYQF